MELREAFLSGFWVWLTTVTFIMEQPKTDILFCSCDFVCVYMLAWKVESKIFSLSKSVTDIYVLYLGAYFHKTYKELISFGFFTFLSNLINKSLLVQKLWERETHTKSCDKTQLKKSVYTIHQWPQHILVFASIFRIAASAWSNRIHM